MRVFKNNKELRDLKIGDIFQYGGTTYIKTEHSRLMSDFRLLSGNKTTLTMGNSNIVSKVVKMSIL